MELHKAIEIAVTELTKWINQDECENINEVSEVIETLDRYLLSL